MKEVTFIRRLDADRPGVTFEGQEFLRDQPVVVTNETADRLLGLEGYEFDIKDTDKRKSSTTEEEADTVPNVDGFGGSQTSPEPTPTDQE